MILLINDCDLVFHTILICKLQCVYSEFLCPLKGALSLLAIPSALVFLAGVLLKESPATDFDYTQVTQKHKPFCFFLYN